MAIYQILMEQINIKRSDVNSIKMSICPLECIVNAGYKVILINQVYHYVGIGWVIERDAENDDYDNIPVIID